MKKVYEEAKSALKTFARHLLKDGLAQCSERERVAFKLMCFEPTDPWRRNPVVIARIKAKDVEDVVDDMAEENIERAIEQVEATLRRLEEAPPWEGGGE